MPTDADSKQAAGERDRDLLQRLLGRHVLELVHTLRREPYAGYHVVGMKNPSAPDISVV